SDDLYSDPQLLQAGIIERSDAEVTVATRNEDVRRPVVRLRRHRQLVVTRDAEHAVAGSGFECVAHETPALRPPRVLHARVEITGDQLGDLVLESLALRI